VNALSDADAVRLYPELADLISLRDAGWRFLPVTGDGGSLNELDGFRAWPGGWVDGVRIYSPTNALGIRTAPTDPPALTWEQTGAVAQVVAELLTLPEPGDRTAPRLVVASAPTFWTP